MEILTADQIGRELIWLILELRRKKSLKVFDYHKNNLQCRSHQFLLRNFLNVAAHDFVCIIELES